MEEELKVLRKLGVATSTEVGELVDKQIRSVIRGLKQLEIYGEIKIMVFRTAQHRRKIYLTNEIYDNLCKTSK